MRNARSLFVLVCVFVLVAGLQTIAYGQEPGHDHDIASKIDPTITPMILPAVEDFAPAPAPSGVEDEKDAEAAIGASGYFEVTDKQKVFSLTPRYRFTPKFSVKASVPIIINRTLTFFNGEASHSGLGDIAVSGEYTHEFGRPSKVFRFQGSVKLPTGDDEYVDEDDHRIPLGTGSVDIFARGQYSIATPKTGILATALYRTNSGNETIEQFGTQTITTNVTNAPQLMASVFGRYRIKDKIWLNLGLSLASTGDGDTTTDRTYSDGQDSTSDEYSNNQGSSLIDVYPGISYDLGVITPYLGARIPVSTSYDNESLDEERDTAIIFQISYRPQRMVD